MSRTGLKTFVYSFCISLFTIFLVNGIYWHTHSKKSSDLKIPNKNIVLFLKDSDKTPTLKAVPIKKIALSVLPEIEKEPQEILLADASDILSSSENEIIMADDLKEFDDNFLKENPSLAEDTPSEKVIDNFDEMVQMPPVNALKLASLTDEIAPPDVQAERITPKSTFAQDKSDKAPQVRGKKRSLIPLVKENEAIVEYPKEQPKPEVKTAHLLLASSPKSDSSANTQDIVLTQEKNKGKIPLQIDRLPQGNTQKNIVIAQRGKSDTVALADKDIPIKSMESGKKLILKNGKRQNDEEWKQMSETKEPSNPWVVAKSAAVTPNHFLKNEKYYNQDDATIRKALNQSPVKDNNEVQVAAETVQNLLIPIPEEIMNEENIIPQLESGKNSEKKNTPAPVSSKQSLTEQFKPEQKVAEDVKPSQEASTFSSKENILTSLGAIFGEEDKSVNKYTKDDTPSVWSNVKEKIRRNKKSSKGRIMPTEMRLSFQPNRAEISGQTLRWIQAFAKRTAEDKNTAIEIRIDGTSSMELQQKRLNLLHNILTNKGVSYGKINTVFTNREPNSFIIRTVTLGNDTSKNNQKGTINRNTGYYLQW